MIDGDGHIVHVGEGIIKAIHTRYLHHPIDFGFLFDIDKSIAMICPELAYLNSSDVHVQE
jgi:hypothetical protein